MDSNDPFIQIWKSDSGELEAAVCRSSDGNWELLTNTGNFEPFVSITRGAFEIPKKYWFKTFPAFTKV